MQDYLQSVTKAKKSDPIFILVQGVVYTNVHHIVEGVELLKTADSNDTLGGDTLKEYPQRVDPLLKISCIYPKTNR